MEYERAADHEGHFNFAKYTRENHWITEHMIPKFHNSIELIVLVSGSLSILINGETRSLSGGDIVCIDKLVPHAVSCNERKDDLLAYSLVISPQYIGGLGELEDKTFDVSEIGEEGFAEIVDFMKWGYSMRWNMNREMKLGFATLLFGILKKNCPLCPKKYRQQNELLLAVLSYIDEHYADKITLSGLAKTFGYEETYLSRIFNSFMRMNLREYLGRYRIAKVNKERARHPSVSQLRIAEKCGFESPNTFYRALKKYSDE